MYALRPEQQADFERLRQCIGRLMAEGRPPRAILQRSCGSGKTVVASHIMANAVKRDCRVLFLAPTRETVRQASEKLTKIGVEHGIIMSKSKLEEQNFMAPVQVATLATLYTRGVRLDRMDLPEADVIVVDECDLSIAPSFRAVLKKYEEQGATILGLTATPIRSDGRGMGELYEDIVVGTPADKLIELGYMVPSKVFSPSMPDLRRLKVQSNGEYAKKDLGERCCVPKLIGDIWTHWEKHARDRKTIVFASTIEHSQLLCEMFNSHGVRAVHVDGNMTMDERDMTLNAFHIGSAAPGKDAFQILCNAQLVSFGYDDPEVSCVINAKPTRNLRTYLQNVGRCQRPYPGKDDCIILDHSGAARTFGLPEEPVDWTLDGETNIKRSQQEKAKKSKAKLCPQCGRAFESGMTCPECGAKIEPGLSAKLVPVKQGNLDEVSRKQSEDRKHSTLQEKQGHWDRFTWISINRGLPIKAAAGMYRKKYGVWPHYDIDRVPKGKREWQMNAGEWYDRHVRQVIAKAARSGA